VVRFVLTADLERYEFAEFDCSYGSSVASVLLTQRRWQVDIVVLLERGKTIAIQGDCLEDECVASKELSVQYGQICVVSPEQSYRIQLENPSELIVVHLPVKTIASAVQAALHSPGWKLESEYAVLDEIVVAQAKALRDQLDETGAIADLYRRTIISLLCIHIVATYARIDAQPQQETLDFMQHTQLAAAIRYIGDHLNEDLKVLTLAEVAGLSQSHFSRVFKRYMGLSPRQYILFQRIELAKTLLKDSQTSLSAISFRCGFCDQSHFILQFRRFMGTTPKAYREDHSSQQSSGQQSVRQYGRQIIER